MSKIPLGLTWQNCRQQAPELGLPPLPDPLQHPPPLLPGVHSQLRLREGHVLGVLGEDISRYKVLVTSLQARVISLSREVNPCGSRSEERLGLLTPRLDFEIRMEGVELWRGVAGWGLPPLPTSPELLGLATVPDGEGTKGSGSREGGGREQGEKAGRQSEGVLDEFC